MDNLEKKIGAVEKQIEAITGKKPTKAEKQRQEILDQRKALKDAERETHSLAYDMLQEFKALNKRLFIIILVLIMALIGSNMAWLYVFQSYDYVSTSTATGFYALADSDGNVIAQDISPEAWDAFNEWWVKNGNSQESKNQN